MTDLKASRTLVKSPPELWAECSDAASLARHLGAFGEIRITRLEPETAVAWEGDAASGTVRLEPSGWGTRVVLTATSTGPAGAAGAAGAPGAPGAAEAVPVAEPEPEPEAAAEAVPEDAAVAAEPEPEPEPEPPASGPFARLLGFFGWRRRPAPEPDLDHGPEAESDPAEPDGAEPDPAEAAAPQTPPTPRAAPDPSGPSQPVGAGGSATAAVLDAALDSLGRAHHRPYSRA